MTIMENYLKKRLLDRGYPKRLVRNAYKRARFYNRDALLQGSKRKDNDKLVCVINHSPINFKVKKAIDKNWHILNTDQDLASLDRPIIAYRRNANLKDKLVHTRPKIIQKSRDRTITGLPPVKGNHRCGTCKSCETAIVTEKWEYKGCTGILQDNTNCRSKNIIHLILCPCGEGYIGETGREFRVRYTEHRSAVRTRKLTSPMVQHCVTHAHSENDLRWLILQKG